MFSKLKINQIQQVVVFIAHENVISEAKEKTLKYLKLYLLTVYRKHTRTSKQIADDNTKHKVAN